MHQHTLLQMVARQLSLEAQVKWVAVMAERDSWSKTTGSNSSPMKRYLCRGNLLVDQNGTEPAEAAACRWISTRLHKVQE